MKIPESKLITAEFIFCLKRLNKIISDDNFSFRRKKIEVIIFANTINTIVNNYIRGLEQSPTTFENKEQPVTIEPIDDDTITFSLSDTFENKVFCKQMSFDFTGEYHGNK